MKYAWTTPGFKWKTFVSSEFFTEGNLIFASTVPKYWETEFPKLVKTAFPNL